MMEIYTFLYLILVLCSLLKKILIIDIVRAPDLCIAEFIIPKGSYVDINQKGEIISDHIMLNKVKSITNDMNNKTFKQIFNED